VSNSSHESAVETDQQANMSGVSFVKQGHFFVEAISIVGKDFSSSHTPPPSPPISRVANELQRECSYNFIRLFTSGGQLFALTN
jgi:hypothetical protein